MANITPRPVTYLTDISPRSWEHPADRAALTALRQIPGFDQMLKALIGATTEKSYRLYMLASTVRVSDRQFAKIHKVFCEACSRLDLKAIPELFISQSPFLNAGAIGVEKPFIVLNSQTLKDLSELELMSVLGHEIGHCVSGHVLYKTMLWILINLPFMLMTIPVAEVVLRLIIMALLEWYRKSELSADRAGLLAVQSPEACYTLEMKMAGGSDLSQMDINEFFVQAAEYDQGGNLLDSVFKLLNLSQQTHPFAVLRLTELKNWVDAGHYEKILSGQYQKRSDTGEDDVMGDFKRAQEQYQEDLKRSKDPLAGALSNAMKNIEPMAKQVEQFFTNIFNPGQDSPEDASGTQDDSAGRTSKEEKK
ncbi:MAG TPA: M48 family peptidase [Spirochaetia bacterium]|nr:M48 family peptidase [Spirochaetia bacterium]